MKAELKNKKLQLTVNKSTGVIDTDEWCVLIGEKRIPFSNASSIVKTERHTEIEDVLKIHYENIVDGLSLSAIVIVDNVRNVIRFQLAESKDNASFDRIVFPGTIKSEKGKLVLPFQQGTLLDSEEEKECKSHFGGCFACADAYVNALGFYSETMSYLWIVDDYFDAFYNVKKEEHQRIQLGTLSSLSHLRYTRTYTLYLWDTKADYNQMAGIVREWYEEKQVVLTLKEKVERKPKLKNLIGSCVYHTGIHSNISPDSVYYHTEGKNEAIVPVEQVEKQIEMYHEKGIGRIHVHVDGCGIAYDRMHPRFYPIDERTGGYPALIHLMKVMHEHNDLLTIHDNYHDLYLDSPDFDEEYQIFDKDGKPFYMAVWAGGKQSYMTGQVAPAFFERNLNYLKDHGVVSDGVYCDVFTCNPMDENFSIVYRQDRRTCAKFRNETFDVENKRGGIVSSEEVNAFAVNHIDTCHYAPNAFMMNAEGTQLGDPIPFFNLVFHDCLVIPWMSNIVNGRNYGLYALLNGGIAYLKRDGAYVNTDGSFSQDEVDEERIQLVKETAKLHEQVAYARMVSHEFIAGSTDHQKTVFDNGITVEINLKDNTYHITK